MASRPRRRPRADSHAQLPPLQQVTPVAEPILPTQEHVPPPLVHVPGGIPQALLDALIHLGQVVRNAQAAPSPPPPQQQMDTRFFFMELKRVQVPSFEGGPDPDEAEKWLDEVEKYFELIQVPDEMKAHVIRPFLIGEANQWWKTNIQPLTRPVAWATFLEEFRKLYIPPSVTIQKIEEFESLKQEPGVTVLEYAHRFIALGRYVPSMMADERLKMIKFERGLNSRIRTWIVNANPRNFGELMDACYRVELHILRRDDDARGKRPQDVTDDWSGQRAKFQRRAGGQPQPRQRDVQRGRPRANARVHAMTDAEVQDAPDVMTELREQDLDFIDDEPGVGYP